MEEMITKEQMEKLKKLQDYLKSLESVTVAFSSGVDSTFLLKVAKDTLGDKVMANSPVLFVSEKRVKRSDCFL